MAIKVSQERFSERFEREARTIAALNHPNICTLFDVGPDYLVMEYLEGHALRGTLELPLALQYAAQAADAGCILASSRDPRRRSRVEWRPRWAQIRLREQEGAWKSSIAPTRR